MHSRLSQWWNEISIRTKITGVTVCLVTLGLLVAGLGTMTVLSTYLYGQVDRDLTTAAQSDHPVRRRQRSLHRRLRQSPRPPTSRSSPTTGRCSATTPKTSTPCSSAPYLPGFTEDVTASHEGAFNGYNRAHTEEWRLYTVHSKILNDRDRPASRR